MKKKNIILCAGVLSLTMMCGCGENTQNETSANVTTEVTQEVTETVDTPETTDTIIADDETKTTTESNTVDEYDSEQPEIQEENTETADTNVDSYAELSSLMTAIYAVGEDSTSVETAAENLKTYAFNYGAPSSSANYESMANDWFDSMQSTEGTDIRSEFRKCFDTVTLTAQEADENLEFDVAYQNVINGISAAIGE